MRARGARGTLAVTAGGDGVSAVTELNVGGGSIAIKATGDPANVSSKAMKAETALNISGGTLTLEAVDHALHSAADVTVSGGTVSALSSAGKGVEAHGNVQLSGGELALDSAKDGIGADGNVEISGGSLKVVSAKDGIQAGADNSSTGDIDILGGAVSVCAQKLAMKAGGRAQISGGELFAVAGTDKADVFSGSSAQAWLVCSYSGAAGSTAAISAGGTTLAEINARFAYSSVLFASSRLAAGTEYTISGGAAETTATLPDRAA